MAFKEIGALWLKDGKKGKYMSGKMEIDGKDIVIFIHKNTKAKDTHPDYKVSRTIDDDEPSQESLPKTDVEDDAIPF